MKTVLMLEGNIGAGKTTLCKALASLDAVTVYEEQMDAQELDEFYADPERFAFSMQLSMFRLRAVRLMSVIQTIEDDTVVVLDRSLIGDYAFALSNAEAQNISSEEMREYTEYHQRAMDSVLESVRAKNIALIVVYLADSARNCRQRVEQRGDKHDIALEYLESLERAHREALKRFESRIQTIVMQWNEYCGARDDPSAFLKIF